MEVLLPAILELFVLFVPAVFGVVGLAVALVTAIVEAVVLVAEIAITGSLEAALAAMRVRRKREQPGAVPNAEQGVWRWIRTSPAVAIWARRVLVGSLALVGVSLGVLLLANFVFFEGSLRLALGRVASSTGVNVEFDHAGGNLFTGEVRVAGLRASRSGHPDADLDVTIDKLDIDLDVASLMTSARRVGHVVIAGVEGTYERKQRKVPAIKVRSDAELLIERLEIDDVALEVHDVTPEGKPVALALEVDTFRSQGLSNRRAAFDLLFDSNGAGAIDGRPWSITTAHDDAGHVANWLAEGLPAATAGAYLGGPLAWLTSGELSVDTESNWSLEDEQFLRMRWRLELSGIRAEAPDDLPWLKGGVVKPMVAFLNNNPRNLPVVFSLSLDPDEFDWSENEFTTQLRAAIARGATEKLAEMSGATVDQVKSAVKDLGGALKGFLSGRAVNQEDEP